MANFDLIVDSGNGRLISSFTSTQTAIAPKAIYDDEVAISVRIVESNNNAELPWRDVDLTGQTIRVGIGKPGEQPTDGTFTLEFGGDTLPDQSFTATTAATLDTALNLLASVISAGGVTVTNFGTTGYKVEFDTVGAQTLITADADGLTPTSGATIARTRTGDGSTQEIQVVTFERTRAAYVELTTDLTAPAATITQIRTGVTGTTSEIQRVQISGDPYAGFYSLTIATEQTGSITVDATGSELKSAIELLPSIGSGNVTITGSDLDYTVEFNKSLGDVGAITATLTNLESPTGKKGTLSLNEPEMLELLDGNASVQATLEIVRFTTSGSISNTVFQGPITCLQDVI